MKFLQPKAEITFRAIISYNNSQRLEITLFSTLASQTGLLKSNYKLNMRVLLHLLTRVDAGNV